MDSTGRLPRVYIRIPLDLAHGFTSRCAKENTGLPMEEAMESIDETWNGQPWFPGVGQVFCASERPRLLRRRQLAARLRAWSSGRRLARGLRLHLHLEDVEAYKKHGSNLQFEIEQLVAEASFVYERQPLGLIGTCSSAPVRLNILLKIGYVRA